jgi:hypothetical protein
MKTCLVSLISDQTIPNILVALHFKPDFLLFLTSDQMERRRKSQAILETLKLRELNYSDTHHKIEVIEDSVIDLQTKAAQWLDSTAEEFQFIVNLTGGTKMMSVAAYDLFKDFGSTMVYVHINRNDFLTPFPKRRPPAPTPLSARLTVLEYLTAYGINIDNQASLSEYAALAESRQELSRFIYKHYREVSPLLARLGRFLRDIPEKKLKQPYKFEVSFDRQNQSQEKLLDEMGFTCRGAAIAKSLTKSDWNYLRGGWLEERLFLAVKEAVPQATDIQLGVVFKDAEGNKNELDVLFTHENVLHLVECKSLGAAEGGEDSTGGDITDFLYKLGAIRQQFGLTPKAWLATTAESIFTQERLVKPTLVNRARQFHGEIVPLLQVPDPEAYFRQKFS